MPYKLRKAPKRDLYWVVGEDGRHKSKDPLPKEQAEAQMRALYASSAKEGKGNDTQSVLARTANKKRAIVRLGRIPPPIRQILNREGEIYDRRHPPLRREKAARRLPSPFLQEHLRDERDRKEAREEAERLAGETYEGKGNDKLSALAKAVFIQRERRRNDAARIKAGYPPKGDYNVERLEEHFRLTDKMKEPRVPKKPHQIKALADKEAIVREETRKSQMKHSERNAPDYSGEKELAELFAAEPASDITERPSAILRRGRGKKGGVKPADEALKRRFLAKDATLTEK